MMNQPKKEILFIVQYPEHVSPGQRFRFELYKKLLEGNNFNVTTTPFINAYGYAVIFKKGFYIKKVLAVLIGFANRLKLIFSLNKYHFILLQIGVTPIGPPVFEWLIVYVFKKKIIYDFDGAIWLENFSDKNKLPEFLRYKNKVASICSWAYKVSCGNQFLLDFAKQFNQNVLLNPTCVDTDKHHNLLANHDTENITIGWTGSFSTLQYLYLLEPVLQKLQQNLNFSLKVICNQKPVLNLKNVEFVEWSIENEIQELAKCQIGIMPLPDNEWTKGKCGFKIIQYMALEIPAIASAVGVNATIIDNNINGILCTSQDEWYKAIAALIVDSGLRKKMGKAGRKKIIDEYSLQANSTLFLSLFN